MQDEIIKGTGNSRYLRSVSDFLTQYPTYEDFANALVDGTLPIDLAGKNAAGIAQAGTPLNKANLLSTEVSESIIGERGKLGDMALGTTVKLMFDGKPRDFIVVQQGTPDATYYGGSANGTWLLMKGWYTQHSWHNAQSNVFATSDIFTYYNTTLYMLFSNSIRNVLLGTKLPYWNGAGNSGSAAYGAHGIEMRCFPLSVKEYGLSDTNAVNDLSVKLAYFDSGTTTEANTKRIAYEDGTSTNAAQVWTRTPDKRNAAASDTVKNNGGINAGMTVTGVFATRPCIVLNSNYYADGMGGVSATALDEDIVPSIALQEVYNELQRMKAKPRIEYFSYSGNGKYGSATPNTLTFHGTPKLVLIWGGYNTLSAISLGIAYPDLILTQTPTNYRMSVIHSDGKATPTLSAGYNNIYAAYNGNTLTWYHSANADLQLNTNNVIYRGIAIYDT